MYMLMKKMKKINHKYPIYIPSKKRWNSRLTVKALDAMHVPYMVVVEPQEYEDYAAVIDKTRILVLPKNDQGLVYVRNWIWERSIANGDFRHWQIDDNISGFLRFNYNRKIPVRTGAIFRAAEDFVDRYTNVALAGFNYRFFAENRCIQPPFRLNRRIYSCSLVKNDLPYRFRGPYNDDTDMSLQVLQGGWCTVLFQAFLCNKQATMTVSGGLTETYLEQGRLYATQVLVDRHPSLARVTKRFGRWHHYVDYSDFRRNKLILRSDVVLTDEPNEYGMVLVKEE